MARKDNEELLSQTEEAQRMLRRSIEVSRKMIERSKALLESGSKAGLNDEEEALPTTTPPRRSDTHSRQNNRH